MPIRHAGSFGFDFAAVEWARDRTWDRYVVRLAAADLPTPILDEIVPAVALGGKLAKADRGVAIAETPPRGGDRAVLIDTSESFLGRYFCKMIERLRI